MQNLDSYQIFIVYTNIGVFTMFGVLHFTIYNHDLMFITANKYKNIKQQFVIFIQTKQVIYSNAYNLEVKHYYITDTKEQYFDKRELQSIVQPTYP